MFASLRRFPSFILSILDSRFSILFVFLFSLAFFTFLQSWGSFPDPDGFYHAKLADVILHGPGEFQVLEPRGTRFAGLFFLQNFPWLDLTSLGDHFADQHLLYHLALLPFISRFGMLPGAQIAAIFFSASFVTILYAILRRQQVQHAWLWSFLSITSAPLAFRLSLVKATPFALTAFVLGLAACLEWSRKDVHARTRYTVALLAGCLFALSHGGWLILLGSQVLFFIGTWIFDRTVGLTNNRNDTPGGKTGISTILSTTVGILVGLLIHPNRANLLAFLKVQVFQVALATPRHISLGLEWGPLDPLPFLANLAPLLIAVCAIALGFVFAARHPLNLLRARSIIGLTFVVAALVAFTFKSGRMVEYLIPVCILWCANLWSLVDPHKLIQELKTVSLIPFRVLVPVLGVLFVAVLVRDTRASSRALREGEGNFERFKPIAAALHMQAEPGTRIFHDRWDAFPELFAFAPEYRYISGLDPTFLFANRSDLAETYEILSRNPTLPIPPEFATSLMIFERTKACRAPTTQLLVQSERVLLCR